MTEYSIIEPSKVEPTTSERSGIAQIDLTEKLDCTEFHIRLWYLEPGDSLTLHRQATQEEFYFVVDGPGQIRVGSESLTVPENACIMVPPGTPRQIFNDTENEQQTWLILGAPAVEDDGRPLLE